MGNDVQTRLRWDQDALTDCSLEDRVWGWSIRASEVLHHDRTQIADECLIKMLRQGLCNQQAGAPAWSENSAVKHGVRFVTSMVVWVLERCLKMNDKVQRLGRFPLDEG